MTEMTDAMRRCLHRPPTLRAPDAVPVRHSVARPVAQEPVEAPKKRAAGLSRPRGRRKMNKTEAAFALILEAKKRAGQILRYEWEGLTLRWPDGMQFTPDFAVWTHPIANPRLFFIETKGAFIEGDALVKFRAARAHWPEFEFQMQQLKKGQWTQVL